MHANRRDFLKASAWIGAAAGLGAASQVAGAEPPDGGPAAPRGVGPEAAPARTIYASAIPGVVLDCDITTGTRFGGGAPTDNVARINAVLATATPAAPVHLVIDGGSALGSALVIPQTGHVTISGRGWGDGFYWLPGCNSSQIQTSNVGTTNLPLHLAIGSPQPQTIVGKNVQLSNFYLNCNRGTFPNGAISDKLRPDGTMPGDGRPDVRGFNSWYWFTSILLVGIENLHIDRLYVYDSVTYAIDLYHCSHIWIDRCRIQSGNPQFSGNTDGIHINGGCSAAFITNCWFSTGDDAIALNLNEGDGQEGSDFHIANCTFYDCQTGVRVHGKRTQTRRVFISNISASGMRFCTLIIGDMDGGSSPVMDCNHSVFVDGVVVERPGSGWNGVGCVAWVCGNAGVLDLRRVTMVDPTNPIPIVLLHSQCVISSLVVRDCGIHRSAAGSSPAYLLQGGWLPGRQSRDRPVPPD